MSNAGENFSFMPKTDPNKEKFLYMIDELKSLNGYVVNKFTSAYPRPHLQNASMVKLLVPFITRPISSEGRSPNLRFRDIHSPIPKDDSSPISPLRLRVGTNNQIPSSNEILVTFGEDPVSPNKASTMHNFPTSVTSVNKDGLPSPVIKRNRLQSSSLHIKLHPVEDSQPSLILMEEPSIASSINLDKKTEHSNTNKKLKQLLKPQPVAQTPAQAYHNHRNLRPTPYNRSSEISPGKTVKKPVRHVSFAEAVKRASRSTSPIHSRDQGKSEPEFKSTTPRPEQSQIPLGGSIATRVRRRSSLKKPAPQVLPESSPISVSHSRSKISSRDDLSVLDESIQWNVSMMHYHPFAAQTDRVSFVKEFIDDNFGGTSNQGNYVQQMSSEASMNRYEAVQKIKSSEIRKSFQKLVSENQHRAESVQPRHSYMDVIMGSAKVETDSKTQSRKKFSNLLNDGGREGNKSSPKKPRLRAQSAQKLKWKEQFSGIESLQEDFVKLTQEVKENEMHLISQLRRAKRNGNLNSLLGLSRGAEKRKTRGEVDAAVIKDVCKTYNKLVDNSKFRQYRGAKLTANWFAPDSSRIKEKNK